MQYVYLTMTVFHHTWDFDNTLPILYSYNFVEMSEYVSYVFDTSFFVNYINSSGMSVFIFLRQFVRLNQVSQVGEKK